MMSNNPNQSARTVAHRAASVVVRRRFVDAMGYWLIWTSASALVLIVASRLTGLEVGLQWWWGWLVLAVSIALVPSLVLAGRHRVTLAQGGGVLDDRLGLNSQIRSAIELESDQASKAQSPGFVALAQEHGESAAAQIEVGRAFDPIDTKHWWRAGLVFVLAIVAGVWMPMRVNGDPRVQAVIPEQAIAKIDDVEDSIRELIDDAQGESPAVQDAIADLESLKEELAQGVDDPDQANARTAAKLEELANALDDQAEQDQDQANELSDRIAEAQNQSQEQDGWDEQLDDFADAIKEQDYEEAQQELDELREQIDQMSDAQREALADQLEDLADAVEPDSLEDKPTDEPTQELADSIREQAEEIREPSESEPEHEQDQPEEPAKDEAENGESGQEQDSELEEPEQEQANEGESQQPSEEPSEDPSDQEGDQGGEDSEEQQPEQSEDGEDGEAETGSGEQTDGQEQQGDEAQEQSQEGEESGREPGQEDEQGQQQEGEEQDRQQGEGDDLKESEPQSSQSDQQDQDQPESGGEEGQAKQEQREGRRSLDESLEEMEKRKERSQRSQEQADDVREQARKLIDPDETQEPPEGESQGVRPQENQQDQRGRAGDEDRTEQENARETDPGAVRDFVPVDASDPGASDNAQPVGKWYAPDGEAVEPGGAKQAAQRFREASEKAQRAIEDQQVPRKYRRVVREAFKRVNDRASELESGAKVAPQGKDAVSKSSEQPTKDDS